MALRKLIFALKMTAVVAVLVLGFASPTHPHSAASSAAHDYHDVRDVAVVLASWYAHDYHCPQEVVVVPVSFSPADRAALPDAHDYHCVERVGGPAA